MLILHVDDFDFPTCCCVTLSAKCEDIVLGRLLRMTVTRATTKKRGMQRRDDWDSEDEEYEKDEEEEASVSSPELGFQTMKL
jgi:hypothetical protein